MDAVQQSDEMGERYSTGIYVRLCAYPAAAGGGGAPA